MHDLINGAGFDSADLMIVGDYARKADQTAGHCLSGYYKGKIGEALQLAKFSVDQTYRTCIIKHYIQGLGVGTFGQDKKLLNYHFENNDSSVADYVTVLIDEINIIKPKVIIVLGEYALQILTGKVGISKWRGSVIGLAEDIQDRIQDISWTIKVIPTLHPSVIHNDESATFLIRMDLTKAIEVLYDPDKRIDYHEINIARNSGDLIRFLDNYPIDKFPDMSKDIETRYGFITCAGISFDGYSGMCIPLWGSGYAAVETARMLYILSQLCEERYLINQNINYDKHISARYGLYYKKVKWDTMLAANIISTEFPKNLGFLTSVYTDMSFYKDEGSEFNPKTDHIDQYYGYNAKDAISAFQIYCKQVIDLKEIELLEFFTEFIMKLFDLYYDIECVGLLCDLNKRGELTTKYESLYSLKKMELDSITSLQDETIINLKSPSQIGKFMEMTKFPVLRHRVDSGFMVVNTDKESLEKMRIADPIEYRHCDLPYEMALRFLNLILLIRRIDKVLEYLNVGIHPNGRIYTSCKIAGTTTGRTAGGQTMDDIYYWTKDKKGNDILKAKDLGQSFQTVTKHGFIVEGDEDDDILDGIIGKDIREMYIPDKGWVLVEVDGSQAEARVCDVLGEDWDSLAEYGKIDKHCKVASMIFTDYTYEDILRMSKKEHSDEGIFMRQIGKHAKHGKNNGLEAFQFATMYLHMANFKESIKKAKFILSQVDKAYPNIEGIFHAQVERALRDTRCLVGPRIYGNPCGRKRIFYKKIDKHYINVAYSWIPQSTISDHTKAAMLRIKESIDKTKVHFVAENHDSVTALVKMGYIRDYCIAAKRELERLIDFRQCTLSRDYDLVIPCEFSIGRHNWGNMHEIKKIKS